MGKPSANNKDIPLRLPVAGAQAVAEESDRLGMSEAEFIRTLLSDYFKARGEPVDFTVPPAGGKRNRLTDQDALNRVLSRIKALRLPAASVQGRIGRFTYDLVWPDRQAAVEIARTPRPDIPDWTIAHITPQDSRSEIDRKLESLGLKGSEKK